MNATVADVMTVEVCSVSETAGFREMVELIEGHRVSALPVLDEERRVVGVVSEADLMLKEDHELAERRRFEPRMRRVERAKAAGTTALELMTAPAITITPHASVRFAARLMHEKGVKRLPVVDRDGRLAGIVSRSDVLKVFMRADEQIRREILDYIVESLLLLNRHALTVEVANGQVTLRGEVERKTEAEMLPSLCHAVDGVVSVKSTISYRYDDERSRERHGVVMTP